MPQTKSAKKRLKQNEKKAARNRQIRNQVKNSIKKIIELINQGNMEEAQNKLPETMKIIDSAWAKGVLHKNKASREKAKIMRKINH